MRIKQTKFKKCKLRWRCRLTPPDKFNPGNRIWESKIEKKYKWTWIFSIHEQLVTDPASLNFGKLRFYVSVAGKNYVKNNVLKAFSICERTADLARDLGGK